MKQLRGIKYLVVLVPILLLAVCPYATAAQVTRTGTVTTIEDPNPSGSQSVTVPADATLCVVMAAFYRSATNWIPSNPVTLNGVNLTTLQKTDNVSNVEQVWLGYLVSPATGSQTLAWNWGYDLIEGAVICVVFYKGVDTSDPIVSSSRQTTNGQDLTGLTAGANDMMVGMVGTWNTPPSSVTDSGQTELAITGPVQECYGGFAEKLGGTGFYFTNGEDTSCAAAVFRGEGTYSNTNPITINDNASAAPYPSTITVPSLSGTVTNVAVTITGLAHTYPDDVRILLVGPQGENVMLMYNQGAGNEVSGVTLTFDDSAASELPDGQITSGTYKPCSDTPQDNMNSPAPAGPYGTSLSVFNGVDPQGDWSLYVLDYVANDSGTISGGWELNITTSCTPISFDAASNSTGDGQASSISWSHTVTSDGSDPILVVGVSWRNSSNDTWTVSSVTYNSQPLTEIRKDEQFGDPPGSRSTALYYLTDPPTGTNTVQVNFSGTVFRSVGGAVSLTGVDQSDPVDAENGVAGATGTSPSVTVTTNTDGAWAVDALCIRNASGTTSVSGGQTERWDYLTSSENIEGCGSSLGPNSPAGDVTMSWTTGTNDGYSMSAVALKPACTSSGGETPEYFAQCDTFDSFSGDPDCASRPFFGNWTSQDGSDATNGWATDPNATGSSSTGPSTPIDGPYLYLESSGSGQDCGADVTAGSSQYVESNTIDASSYAFSFEFDWNMNVSGNTDASLHVDAWNGSSWDLDVNGSAINTGNYGDVWVSQPAIGLSSYTNSDFKIRIRYVVGTLGNVYQNDVAVDNLCIYGDLRLSPPVATDATNILATSFSANWNASSGATGYRLDVATDSGFTSFVTGYNDLDVGDVTTYSVSSNISPDTTYYYRVRAYNGSGTTENSNTSTLTTTCLASIVETGNATEYSSSGTAVSITHGLTIDSGDVVVALIAANGNGTTITDNNGSNAFTQAIQEDTPASGGTMRYAVYYRVAGASEPSSYAWTLGSTQSWSVVVRVFSGVDTTSVWDVAPSTSTRTGSSSDGTTATAPSMTTATAGAMGIVAFFSDGSGTTYSAPTNGYGELVQENGGRTVASAIRTWATAGTTGTTSATLTSNDWTAHQFSLKPASVSCSPPPAGSFSYRKPIIIDHTEIGSSCGSDLSNFPVMIKLTAADFQEVENDVDADGYDIVFKALDDTTCGGVGLAPCTLDHEMEVYDEGNDLLVAWVRIPTLSISADTTIYMYYGNPAISSPTENPSGVWDAYYKGVWHLSESSGDAQDSTSYGTSGSVSGTVTQGSTGNIDYAYDFYTGGEVNCGDPADGHLDGGTGSWTVSLWVNIDDNRDQWEQVLYKGGSSEYGHGYSFEVYSGYSDLSFIINDGNSQWGYQRQISFSEDTWHHIVGVVDRSNDELRVYKDGAQEGAAYDITDVVSIDSDNELAFSEDWGWIDGLLDEVHISAVARDACWIGTEYSNQKPSSIFLSVDPEEVIEPTAGVSGTITSATTEADIVSGGKTIVITLANDTWVAAGAEFDAQRQNIINGLNSAQSEATGWNNEVRDNQSVSGVVRTSETVVTITLDAQSGYDISSNETITATVPASALVTSSTPLVATPTFDVSYFLPSALALSHYRWRNDDGGEAGTNGSISVEDAAYNTAQATSSLTISSFTVQGSNRLMVVGVSINNDNYESISGITWNGTEDFTWIRDDATDDDARTEIWYLKNPTATTASVVVTFSAALAQEAIAGVVTFTGADLTDGNTFKDDNGSAWDSEQYPSTTVTSEEGDVVFGVVGAEYDTVSSSNADTEHWLVNNFSSTTGGGYTKAGEVSNTTISWTLSAATHTAVSAVSIKPAAGGSAATFDLDEDTELTDLAKNTNTRVRFLVSNSGGTSSGVNYQLEFAETDTCGSGSYDVVPASAGAGDKWHIVDSTYITDGEATSDIQDGVDDALPNPGGMSFVPGELRDDNSNSTSGITLDQDQFTEIEFTIQATDDALDGTHYCFRLTDSGTDLDSYSYYAEVTLAGVAATTTLGDGTDPGDSTVAPGSADQYLNQFTLATSTGSDSVTALTVTTANTDAIASVEIWDDTFSTQYFSTDSNPNGNLWEFSGGTAIPVTTTPTSFRIRFTAKDHGTLTEGTYAVTGTVTSFTCTNSQVGTDTDSATITVDNTPPSDATWGTITAGDQQVELNWTNPGVDFNKVIVLRREGSAVGDAPSEGSEYSVGNTIGSSTVRYVGNLETFTDSGLTNGTDYYYKIFAYDDYINYASGTGTGPHTPSAPNVNQAHVRWRNDDGTEDGVKVNSGHTTYSSGGNLYDHVIDTPPHSEGDVIYIAFGCDLVQTITWPTGFTGGQDDIEGNATWGLAYKVAGASEPSTYTVTIGTEERAVAIAWSVSNDGGIDGSSTVNGGDGTIATCNSATTTEANDLVLRIVATDIGWSSITHSTITDYTMLDKVELFSGASLSVQYIKQASAGPTGTADVTITSEQWGSATTTIKPAAGGTAATFDLAEDTELTDLAKNTNTRVRFLVSNSGNTSSGVNYQLEFAETDTCGSGSYSAVPASAAAGDKWHIVDSTYITDGEATSDVQDGVDDALPNPGGMSFVPGELRDDNSNSTSGITLDQDQFTEIEFTIQATDDALDGTHYCFRLTDSGSDLDNYAYYAEVTLAGVAPTATPLYRSVGITGGTLASGGAGTTQAFKIQRGTANVPNTGTTQTAPGDFTAFSSLTSAFVLNKNNRFGSAGRSTPYDAGVLVDDLSLRIELTATDTITFTRLSTGDTEDYRADWESWEYVGAPGGPNEFIVRSRNTVTITAPNRTNTATLSNNPTDIDKCIPFITGISNTGQGQTSQGLTALAWISGTNTLNIERGGSTEETVVQVVTVEFTGSNWRVAHGRTGDFSADDGTVTLYSAADGQTNAFILNNIDNAIIASAQFKGDDADLDSNFAIADTYPVMYISDTATVTYHFDSQHDGVDNQIFVHVLENADMSVTRYTDNGSLAGDNDVDITSAGVSDLTNTAIFATRESSGTGTAFPRGWMNYRLTGNTNAALWCSRSGNSIESRIEIAVMPMDASAGTNELVISGSTASFSAALDDNIGVGDVIQYDSDDDDIIDALAFVHGRTDSQTYTVKDKDGNVPTAVTSDYDWAIHRAYTSLENCVNSQTENPNITEPVENDVNPNKNLVFADTILNVACYADGDDTDPVTITGWTTGADNYINIYTPTSVSEVGATQRHSGVWDTSKYILSANDTAIYANENTVTDLRIDGLQIEVAGGDYSHGIVFYDESGSVNFHISNNIVRDASGASTNQRAIYIGWNWSGGETRIWNNIVYGFNEASDFGILVDNGNLPHYLYNNTVRDCTTGIRAVWGSTVVAKNNVVQDCGTCYSAGDGWDGNSTNNCSDDGSHPGGSGQAGEVTFKNELGDPPDLRLDASDSVARENGADLHTEFFDDDIEGESRPGQSDWDMGADEYVLVVAPTTTLGDGSDPGDSTVAPGSADQYLNQFTLATSTGSDSVTALTVTTANTDAIASVEIWDDAFSTQYFSTDSTPNGNLWEFSGGTAIPVTTTPTSFRIRFTAKDHASLAAGTYAVTGTVTSFTCTNSQAGNDTDSATITVDNTPPSDATWGTITPGDQQVELNWTNPGADFNKVIILRREGSAVGDTPSEGTEYSVGNTIGSSTVRYVGNLETFTDTGLTNGTDYYYKVFAYDDYINYASGTGTGPHTPAGSGGSWYNTDWQYRKHLRIDSSRVAGDLNYFPVLINTTDADWIEDSEPTPGHVAQTDGGDILFTASDGTTKLDHEIEKYDPSTGQVIAWVEVPTVSGSIDTGLYIYYGNTVLAEGDNQWNVSGTWDEDGSGNYRGVWHLKEEATGTGTTDLYEDSTENPNDGDDFVSATAQDGQINGGQEFDGNDDYVLIPDSDSLDISQGTLEAWIKTDISSPGGSGFYRGIISKATSGGCSGDTVYGMDWEGTGNFRGVIGDSGGCDVISYGIGFSTTDWYHVAFTWDGTDLILYVNGAEVDNQGQTTTPIINTNPVYIGTAWGTDNHWDGYIDEGRISSIARTPEWIQTEYNNQKAPAAFYTVGIEETPGAGADPFDNGWSCRKRISIDSAQVSCDLTNFPVLIKTTDPDLTQAQADFDDILFIAADGSTKLDHEIEKYNSSTGEIVVWVEVPSVSSTSDTDIYLYYGNANSVDQRNPTGAGVWEPNYVGVWHLSESPNDGVAGHLDSTWNSNDGTPQNFQDGGGGTTDAAGKIGGADSFAGDDDEVLLPNPIIGGRSEWTMTAWMKTASAAKQTIYGEGNLSTGNYLYIDKDATSYVEFYLENPPYYPIFSDSTNVEDDEFHHVAIVQRSTTDRGIIVDGGSEVTNSDNSGTPTHNTASIGLLRTQGWTADPFLGIIDEVRISKIDRDACWIEAEHSNQSNPDGFYTIGIEEEPGTSGDPFENGWTYRKRLTIDASRVAGDLTNFPVLINTTDADWIEDEQATPGHVAQTDGGDILFTASDGITKLDHEIEKYDPVSGELVAWVEVLSLSGSANTDIYIYYGNTSLNENENQWNVAGVWGNNFREVFHLHEASGTLNDSTGSYTGAAVGTATLGVAGKISNAVEFDGSVNGHVTLSDGSMAVDQTFTFSAWVWADTLNSEWEGIVTKGRDSDDDWQGLWINGSDLLCFGWEADGGPGNLDGSSVSAGKWYYVAATYDGSDRRLYLNGALDAGPAGAGAHDTTIDEGTIIGEDYPNGSALDGIVDEVRISTIPRPADWIETEYNNQRAPAAFYTVGIEEQDGTGAEPFNNGWQYSKKITLLASEVAADLTNFPILIRETYTDWADTSNGGNVAQSDGGDILFVAGDRATKLDHEIEKYDPATGELVVWVEVRSLSSNNDTDIYIFYGNGDAVDQWNPTGAGVWEPNYKGVWHLKETPADDATGEHKDSTVNTNHGTPRDFQDGDGGTTDAQGIAAGADKYESGTPADDRVEVPDDDSLTPTGDLTVEAWVKLDTVPGSTVHIVYKRHNGSPYFSYQMVVNAMNQALFQWTNSGGTHFDATMSSGSLSAGIWYHLVGVRDGTTVRLYVNGSDSNTTTATTSGTYLNSDVELNIGAAYFGGTCPDAIIDEVRISKVARSAAWIETQHNNQKAGSTFYVIDDDWVDPCWDANYDYRKKIVITAGSADIPAGYSVSVTLNHAALVSDGKSLENGDDIRVVHWDGESSTWTELDRALEPLSSWNDVSTQIWFALVDPISASSSDGTYYLHYGYSSASNPPDDWANVFMVGDDFNDGTLTTGLTASTSGTASITESGGLASIAMGENAGDAGILVTTNSLPSDKKFAIRHKTNLVSGGGGDEWFSAEVKTIGISQYSTRPTVADSSIEATRRRIVALHCANEEPNPREAWIEYNPDNHGGSTQASWNFIDPEYAWVEGNWEKWGDLPLDTYYIYDLISNGTSWYARVSNASGTVLTETDPVLWSVIEDYNPGDPMWFYWGEVYTNAYYADQKSDWFYVRTYIEPEPTSALGGEEEGCRGEATAVSLLSFTAEGEGSSVLVEWETAQEVDNMGFNLYRAESPGGSFTKLNDALIPGLSFSVRGKAYSYTDSNVTPGKLYYYKLEDIDVYGKKKFHGPICVDWDGDGMPDDWEIAHGLNPAVHDSWNDPDDDGLSNLDEYKWSTDPLNPDTDGDGILDGDEDGKVGRDDIGETRSLGNGVEVVASDENGATLELRTEAYEMEIVEADGVAYQRLRIVDYIHGLTQEVGKPELPVKGILLDVPDGASPSLSVESVLSQTYAGFRLYPVPENTVQGEEGAEYVGEVFTKDETAYSTDAFYPVEVAGLGQIFTFRDQRKLQVVFHPLVFNPVSGELMHYTRIRVRVEYGVSQEESTTARSLSRAVSSPSVPRTAARAVAWSPPATQGPVYKVFVSEEGIYRMSGSWLKNHGVNPADITPNEVQLYNMGQEVGIRVYDEDGDNWLDSGDYIEFYGEPVAGEYRKYAENNVYWLTDAGVSGGLRMGSMDGDLSGTQVPVSTHTSTVRYEEDRVYDNSAPGPDSLDRWFFDVYVTGSYYPPDHPYYGGVGTEFDLHLPDVAGQGSLTVALYAPFDLDHELEVRVNSTVRTFTWSGISYHEVRIDGVDLLEGLNTVTLRCNEPSDGFLVDWLEVTYPRVFVANSDMLKFSYDAGSAYQISGFTTDDLLAFDITTATDVKQIEIPAPTDMGGSYTLDMEPQDGSGERTYLVLSSTEVKVPGGVSEVVDTDLAGTSNGADYILITHRDLGWDGNGDAYSWLSGLVALRQGQGLRVKVVDVEEIYNEFGYGIATPQAIKDFLSYAYNNWVKPAPQYVLLVGDSTYDYKDNLGLGTINFVPAYLSWTEHMGEALTDDWFARVSGSDAIPDLYIGRLPAATVTHAATMVEKIVAYESTDNSKTWEKNALLVADDQTEDYEALFEIMNNDVAALIPAGMNKPFTEYLADYAGEAALNTAIKNKIRDGSLIVNYSGHGSVQRWGFPVVFQVSDVEALENGMDAPKYPFFVSMTCLNGHFGYPETGPTAVSLAEVLLRSENEGAVGAFMSTGMTAPEGQRVLDEALFDAIFKQDNRALGLAVCMAKQTLLANGAEFGDVSTTFLLFGDPATRLKVPLPTVPAGVAAQSEAGSVVLSWQAAADCNGGAVTGYNVYRSATAGAPYEKVNTELITGTGFTDSSAASGTWYYVITSVDGDGDESAPSAELGIVAGSRTLSGGSAEGAGGGGGGCFIGTIAD